MLSFDLYTILYNKYIKFNILQLVYCDVHLAILTASDWLHYKLCFSIQFCFDHNTLSRVNPIRQWRYFTNLLFVFLSYWFLTYRYVY